MRELCFKSNELVDSLEENSSVEIRLYDYDTDKFLYKRLTKSEWAIIKNIVSDEKWSH